MTIFYDPRCLEYSVPGHPERPDRIAQTVPSLKDRHPDWEWRAPIAADEIKLLRAHSPEHLQRIKSASHDFDADTPAYSNIYEHALRSVGAALGATQMALGGSRTFSLIRPPGHHATRDRAMGFCYLNNVAIAALEALESGLERVAIWDFDGHHGNGTEAIVAHDERIRFASMHQFPAYPGSGSKSFANINNYPVAPFTPRNELVEIAERAFGRLISFKPDLLLVSAGFDAYARDPLLQLTLEGEDFAKFGEWLNRVDVPVAVVLEGGYSSDLPVLIGAFLTAWDI